MATTISPIKILSDLGLNPWEIENDEDYLRALKEGIITIESATKGKGDRRSEILREELIRVRKEKKAAPPKDINVKEKKSTIKGAKLLPGTTFRPEDIKPADIDPESKTDQSSALIPKRLDGIADSVESIATLLRRQLGLQKKQQIDDRKQQDKLNKDTREDKLEAKPDKKTGGLPKAIVKPTLGFFDRIKKFFFNIIIGSAVYKMFDWLKDPANAEKIGKVTDFLIENAPLILGGLAALALLPIVGSLVGMVGGIMGGISLLGGVIPLIPLILKALLIAAVVGTLGWGVGKIFKMNERRILKKRFGGDRGFIEEGILADELALQYGSGASKKEREENLTNEEKVEASFLNIYRSKLKERGKLHNKLMNEKNQFESRKKNWEKRGLDLNNVDEWPEKYRGFYYKRKDKIDKYQKEVDDLTSVIEQIKSQLRFGGKSLEEVGDLHSEGLYHQTGISKAGEGEAYGLGYSKKTGWDTWDHKGLKKYSENEILEVFSEEQNDIDVPGPSTKNNGGNVVVVGGGNNNSGSTGTSSGGSSSSTPKFPSIDTQDILTASVQGQYNKKDLD